MPKTEINGGKVTDMTEKLVESIKLSCRSVSISPDDGKVAAEANAEDAESQTTAADTFVHKQAMTFIDLIVGVKDDPEVSYSDLAGIVFALRHLMKQSGWKPTNSSLPPGS